MTPHLLDALARLAPLGLPELTLVSATATALMAQAASSAAALTPTLPSLAIPKSPAAPVEHLTDALQRRPRPRRAKQDVDRGSSTLIGGPDLSLDPSPSFAHSEFLAHWRPGRCVQVYLAGSRSLATLMRRLHRSDVAGARRFCAFKVGTHAGPDLGGRLRRLSAERYGSIWRKGTATINDPLWGDWTVEPLNPGTANAATGSPLRIGVESIEVVLPATLTPAAFDQRLGTLLAPSTLAAFALSPAGRERCAASGEDPASFVRYSHQNARQPSRATEITLIGRHDIGRLVRLIEQVILDQVLVEPSTKQDSRAAARKVLS